MGDTRHGVNSHAVRLVAAADAPYLWRRQVAELPAGIPRAIVHFTDRLFGEDCAAAAVGFTHLANGVGHLVTVLHDLPQASDGAGLSRRLDCYRRVAAASSAVVVSSHHERKLLHAVDPDVSVTVVPIPLQLWNRHRVVPPRRGVRPTVATLGYLYPGKGLEELLEAVAVAPDMRGGVDVVNLGGVSPGHEGLVGELQNRAQKLGVAWRLTGWLEEHELRSMLVDVTVPVAPHRHISASASMMAWMEAGRRPLVTDSAFTRETDQRLPGTLNLMPPFRDGMVAAVRECLANPRATWLDPAVHLGPSPIEVVRLLEEL